jgi:hypothetical protein
MHRMDVRHNILLTHFTLHVTFLVHNYRLPEGVAYMAAPLCVCAVICGKKLAWRSGLHGNGFVQMAVSAARSKRTDQITCRMSAAAPNAFVAFPSTARLTLTLNVSQCRLTRISGCDSRAGLSVWNTHNWNINSFMHFIAYFVSFYVCAYITRSHFFKRHFEGNKLCVFSGQRVTKLIICSMRGSYIDGFGPSARVRVFHTLGKNYLVIWVFAGSWNWMLLVFKIFSSFSIDIIHVTCGLSFHVRHITIPT